MDHLDHMDIGGSQAAHPPSIDDLSAAAVAMREDLDAAAWAGVDAPDDAEADQRMLAALEARLRERAAGLDLQPLRAPGDPLRWRLPRRHANAALRLARIVKRTALGLFDSRQRDK